MKPSGITLMPLDSDVPNAAPVRCALGRFIRSISSNFI